MIGDTDHYFSPYVFGVAQACTKLSMWHSQVSIRQDIGVIRQRVRDVQPNLLWTHMLLWAPRGAPPVDQLIDVCWHAKQDGTKVIIHDGDVKTPTRHPQSLAKFVDLALCNHRHDRSAWKVPTLFWPYAAFAQEEWATPRSDWTCDVAFAGQLTAEPVYHERTRFLGQLRKSGLAVKVIDSTREPNTLFRTPELAASALCVLGFGRPETADWIDTRVFQYPGAGAILLHDDVRGLLESDMYVQYKSGDVASAVAGVKRLKSMPEAQRTAMRCRAMAYVQKHHSWVARVEQVLGALEL